MARPSRWTEVVESAAKVFHERGFADATLEEIADNLGMLKGSLYTYINSKEDLLAAVIAVPADRLIQQATVIAKSDRDSEAKLRALVECHISVIVKIYDFAGVYLHEVAKRDLDPRFARLDKTYTRIIEQAIKEGIDDGTLRADVDAHVAAMTVLGACNWLTKWWDPAGPAGADAIVDQISDAVLVGMLNAGGPIRRGRVKPPRTLSARSARNGAK